MKRFQLSALALAAVLAAAIPALASAPAPAAGLDLIPSDALAVGQVRFDRLKTSAASAGLFHEADAVSADGNASRFLKDAGLDPKHDVDSAVFCLTSVAGKDPAPLVVFEGRFHPDALAAASVTRGAVRIDAAPLPYYRLPARAGEHAHEAGAVAFLSPTLVVAGSEPALLHALDVYSAGTAGLPAKGFVSDAVGRVDTHSAVWAVVDTARLQQLHRPAPSADGTAAQLAATLRSLSLLTFQANVSESAVSVSASGFAPDEETRQNLEDVLRGVLAAWRMSAQSKNPELVSAIRKIRVAQTGDGVTISGDLPMETFREKAAPSR